jgi:hypothetical protein
VLEEVPEGGEAVALADARQTGMIRKRLAEIIADIPAQTEPVGRHPHQLALGANTFKEHDQLQFEEDNRINGRAASRGIERRNQGADKGEVEGLVEMAVEMVRWDQLL